MNPIQQPTSSSGGLGRGFEEIIAIAIGLLMAVLVISVFKLLGL